MTALSPQPYKGTRDYYPAEKRLQNYIFDTWRRVVERFGYEEYGAPLLENIEIYAAKSGTELVNEQTYSFTDRGGRAVAIRPEMTPSISRMVAARRQELAYPAWFYSIANFMRYERPQRGREREFWQLNVDIFGADNWAADSEIITIADAILKEFGATADDYTIRVNNRGFIHAMMAEYLGLSSEAEYDMIKLFDRRNKISETQFIESARAILGEKQSSEIDKILAILNAKAIEDLPEDLQKNNAVADIQRVLTALRDVGVESAIFDATLMRGLDYYTGTVFEVFDNHPENSRALFGGGRYDGLVGLFGAEPLSAVGMAPGGTMIENFLQVHGLLPPEATKTAVYVVVIGPVVLEAQQLAQTLRASDINVEVDVTGRKFDKQLKTALKKNIPYLLFVGPDDVARGQYSLKNAETETEETLSPEEIIEKLQASL